MYDWLHTMYVYDRTGQSAYTEQTSPTSDDE